MTGLYVHIPFCTAKCHYCDFVIALAGDRGRHAAFLSALEKEAAHHRARFAATEFDTLYLGGGTPSILRVHELERVFAILQENFNLKKEAEVTCEVNPGDADADKAASLKKLGVTRVSFGAQSFHDRTLERANRAHDAAAIGASMRILREAGFANINLDLILSMPGETLQDARVSIERAVELRPEHLSLYELTVEPKTVFADEQKKGLLDVPSEEMQLEILSTAREALKNEGYRHYELLNYAKPGYESRHNQLYWANREYLGLGPGAYSYIEGRRFKSSATYDEYLAKMTAADWSAAEEETLTPEKAAIESFLLALRLIEGATARAHQTVLKKMAKEILELEEKGLLLQEDGRVRLTRKGQFLAESVFSQLSSC